ncbi:MAG: UDP binding domain-containing protein, partial [Anaerolineales bacterium]|nr:UDP binding domain-containing protein [Anaerolineales bacterium]
RVMEAMKARGELLKGSKCLVLGAAYKPDIDDLRESPALDVIGLLQKNGAEVSYHDPYIPHLHTHDGLEMESVPDLMAAVRASDCVVIVTNHKVYDYQAILEAAKFIFDSRNALGRAGKESPKVVRL